VFLRDHFEHTTISVWGAKTRQRVGAIGVELGRCCVFDARQGSVFSAAGEEVV
jgi:hypothetical protein